MNHTVRIGRRDADDPANDLYGIEFEEADDDGKILVSGGIQPVCPDCGHGTFSGPRPGTSPTTGSATSAGPTGTYTP